MIARTDKYLYDIAHAIELIESFLQSTPTFAAYEKDSKTKSAVERQLVIIGEAINKINSEITFSHSRAIINFRNRLVHAYDNIDDSIIWAIKTNHLPLLKEEVIEQLNR